MARKFSRRTIVAACEAISGHDEIDRVILALGVPGVPKGKGAVTGLTVRNKAHRLAAYVLDDPRLSEERRGAMIDAVIGEAIRYRHADGGRFVHALGRDGYDVTYEGELKAQLPAIADLPVANDEVHALLDELAMVTTRGHLDSAIENHSRGDWPAANGQLRTTIESLTDEIALRLVPDAAKLAKDAKARRLLLTTGVAPPFLRPDLDEWHPDKQSFLGGLIKRLNTEGSHPGLSDDEECTLRLHLVLVTVRNLLRRAKARFGG